MKSQHRHRLSVNKQSRFGFILSGLLTCACTFFKTKIQLIFKKTNFMKKNLYSVKITVTILDKKTSFKLYNIEAEDDITAKSKAWLLTQQSARYEMKVTNVQIKS